ASWLPLFPTRKSGPGESAIRNRKGRLPGIGSLHGPTDRQLKQMNALLLSPTLSSIRWRRGRQKHVWLNIGCTLIALALLTGCATPTPYDYTNYREHPPRSILVLPPLNESTAVGATYSYLSTVTRPLAEMGYYVFPVAVVDQFLKENGLPSAGEMHQ